MLQSGFKPQVRDCYCAREGNVCLRNHQSNVYVAVSISQSRICFSLHNGGDVSQAAEDVAWKEGVGGDLLRVSQ